MDSQKQDSITKKVDIKESYKTEPIFSSVKDKADVWFKAPKDPKSAEMDSVNFHDDRFELIVDARGYRPEDLKCVINPLSIEILAEKIEGNGSRKLCTSRNYEFQTSVNPSQAVCCLSEEGLLLVAVPWYK